jgi:type IV pilus assembly protein PilW
MTITKTTGFTLVEIMVSLAISSLVIAGIYGVYTIQQRSYTTQEQVAEMQQKIRAAMDFMSSDMRMAGHDPKPPYDPNGACDGAKILKADINEFSFQYCKVKKSGTGYSSELTTDTYSFSSSSKVLGILRNNATSAMPLAEGVDAIQFRYFNASGTELSSPVTQPTTICTVQVSMLVRASYPDPHYTNNDTYTPWVSVTSPKDNYHRRLLVTSIQLRNNI